MKKRQPLQYIDIVPFILHLVSSCLHISPSILKSGQFSMQGLAIKHSACLNEYAVGGPLSICTPYQAGVEYDCFFLATFVQNAQKKLRKRLHTFFIGLILCIKHGFVRT